MITHPLSLDPAFIDSQRHKLVEELTQLSSAITREEDEERSIRRAAEGQADESEELAQDLTISENNRVLIGNLADQRLAIDRALAKIDEGTYGFSDLSGESIGVARLTAFPAAIFTTAEEAEKSSTSHRNRPA
jgi:DnaK suppressor protein